MLLGVLFDECDFFGVTKVGKALGTELESGFVDL